MRQRKQRVRDSYDEIEKICPFYWSTAQRIAQMHVLAVHRARE